MGYPKRPLWLWLLVLLCAPGCIDRSRINSTCEWTRDSVFPLDMTNPAHQQHLIGDAQLAEELSVRYADTEHKRRFGYERHGGLIDYGRVVHECMAKLVTVIERDHGVTAAQIDQARGRRDWTFDSAVMLSFGGMYALGAAAAGSRIRRRFFDSPIVATTVMAGASLGFSVLGIQLGALWTAIWECVRIGDDHLGTFRAAHDPWGQHLGDLFIAGIVLFWIVAALAWRLSRDTELPVEGFVTGRPLSG
jgi:hypothetical protein